MRVKINNKWYDSSEQPIAVELSASDKQNIANMLPGATIYAECDPDRFKNDDDFMNWMKKGTAKEGTPGGFVERTD